MGENLDSHLQVSYRDYIARLDKIDQGNVGAIAEAFPTMLARLGKRGTLLAVGGTVTKPGIRKDIDCLLVLEEWQTGSNVPATEYKRALEDMEVMTQLVRGMSQIVAVNNLGINEPIIDQWGSEDILRHAGSITMICQLGHPIELIRSNDRGYDTYLHSVQNPFVLLGSNV